jgi:DNA (cytosine-5)-methyltransferase 1
MKHGSLFSGIGGFELAAEWMGWDNVFHCEWNEFGKQVLHYYWPKSISYHDITKTDFTIHRGTIDILTGGFPCQPYSAAGKRLGKEDDRHLWPEMLRTIKEVQPRWVVGENVLGLINWNGGLVFDEVQADLEAKGYEVWPYVLPAVSVNAPHRRDRVWFVAYSASKGREEREQIRGQQGTKETGTGMEFWPERFSENGNVTDTFNKGLQRNQRIGTHGERNGQKTFRPATQQIKIQSWDNWPTQSPVCGRDDGFSARLDRITFSKWRNESIKAYGNAIVPQVVFQIFKAIEAYERL